MILLKKCGKLDVYLTDYVEIDGKEYIKGMVAPSSKNPYATFLLNDDTSYRVEEISFKNDAEFDKRLKVYAALEENDLVVSEETKEFVYFKPHVIKDKSKFKHVIPKQEFFIDKLCVNFRIVHCNDDIVSETVIEACSIGSAIMKFREKDNNSIIVNVFYDKQ